MTLRRGTTHYAAKLTDEQVRAMRALKQAGKSTDEIWDEIGRPAGISHSHVEKIVLGLAWKHIQ